MVRFLGNFGTHSDVNAGEGVPLAPFLKKCTHWKIGDDLVDMSCLPLDYGNEVTKYQGPPYTNDRRGCETEVSDLPGWENYTSSGLLFEDQTLCEKIHDRVSALGGYDAEGIPFAHGPGNVEGDRNQNWAAATPYDYHKPGSCEWTYASPGHSLLGLELAPGLCGGADFTTARGSGIIQGDERPLGDNKIPLIIDPPQSHYAYKLPGRTEIKDGWQATGYVEIDESGRLVVDSNGDPVGDFYGGSGYLVPLSFGISLTSAGPPIVYRYHLGLSGTGDLNSVTVAEAEGDSPAGWYPNFHTICIGPDIGFGPGRWGNGHVSYPRVLALGGHAPTWVPSHCSLPPYFHETGHMSGVTHQVGAREWQRHDLTAQCCPGAGPSATGATGYCLSTPEFIAPEGNSFIAGFGAGTVIGFSNTEGETNPGTPFPWKGYSDLSTEGPLRTLGAAAVGGAEPSVHKMKFDQRPRDANLAENVPVADNVRGGLPWISTGEEFSAGPCGPHRMITEGDAYPPSHITPDSQGGRWCPEGNGQEWIYSTGKNPHDGSCCPIVPMGISWTEDGTAKTGDWECCGATADPPSYGAGYVGADVPALCSGDGGIWITNGSFGPYAPRCCSGIDRNTSKTCDADAWSGCRAEVTSDELGLLGSPPYYPHVPGSSPTLPVQGGRLLLDCTGCENCFDGDGNPECVAWTGLQGAPGMEEAITGYWTSAQWGCSQGVGDDCPDGEYGESQPGANDGRGDCCTDPRDNCIRHTGDGNPANCGYFAGSTAGCAPDTGVKIWGYGPPPPFGQCDQGEMVNGEWAGVHPSAVPCPGGISELFTRGIGTPRLILQCYHSHANRSDATIAEDFTKFPMAGMSSDIRETYITRVRDLSRKFTEWLSPQHAEGASSSFGETSSTRRGVVYGDGTGYVESSYTNGYWNEGGKAGCRDMNPTGHEPPHRWHPSGIVDGIHIDSWSGYLMEGTSYQNSGHRAQYYPFRNTLNTLAGKELGDEASEGVGDFLSRSGQMYWPRPNEEILHWADGSSLGSGVYYDHFPYGSEGVYSHLDTGDPDTGCRVRAYLVYDFFEGTQDSDFMPGHHTMEDASDPGPSHGELELAGHGATGYCTMKVSTLGTLDTVEFDGGEKVGDLWICQGENACPPKTNSKETYPYYPYLAAGSGFFETPSVRFVPQSGQGAYCGKIPSGTIAGTNIQGGVQSTDWTWGDGAYDEDHFNQLYYEPEGDGAAAHVEMKLFDLHVTTSGAGYSHPPSIVIEAPVSGHRDSNSRECSPTGTSAWGAQAKIENLEGTVVALEVVDGGWGYYMSEGEGPVDGELPDIGIGGPGDKGSIHASFMPADDRPQGAVTGTPVMGVIGVFMCSGGCGYTEDFEVTISGPGEAKGIARVNCGEIIAVDIIDAGDDGEINGMPSIDWSAGEGEHADGIPIIGVKRIVMDEGFAPVGAFYYSEFGEDTDGGCKMDNLEGLGGIGIDGPGGAIGLLNCCGDPEGLGCNDDLDVNQTIISKLRDADIRAVFGSGTISQEMASGITITNHGYGYTSVPRVTMVEYPFCKTNETPAECIAEMTLTKVVLDEEGTGYLLPPEAFFECEGKLEVNPAVTTSAASTAIGKCWPSGFSTGMLEWDRNRALADEYGGTNCAEARWAKQYNDQCETFTIRIEDPGCDPAEEDCELVTVDQKCCHPNGTSLSAGMLGIDRVYVTYGGDSYDEFGRAISYKQPNLSRGISTPVLPYIRFSSQRALKTAPGYGLQDSCSKGGGGDYDPGNAGRLSSEPTPFYYDQDPGSRLNSYCGGHAYVTGVDANGQIPLGTGAIVIDEVGAGYYSAPEVHFVGLNGWRETRCSSNWFYNDPEEQCNAIPLLGTKGQLLYPTGYEHTEMGKWESISAPHPSGSYAWPMGVDNYWARYNAHEVSNSFRQSATKQGPDVPGKLCAVGPDVDSSADYHAHVTEQYERRWLEINVPHASFVTEIGGSKYGLSAVWVCDDFNCEADGDTRNLFYLASGFANEGTCCDLPGSVEVWNPNCACEVKGEGVSGHGLLQASSLKASPVLSSEDWKFLTEHMQEGEARQNKIQRVEYVKRAQKRETRPENPTPLTNGVGMVEIKRNEELVPETKAPSIDKIVPAKDRGRVVDSKEEDIEKMQMEAWEKNKGTRGGFAKQTKRYMNARQKWTQNGKPVRSQERINEIFKTCQRCPHFTGSACSLCGCRITMKGNFMNKLAWATESCPDNPPRWEADVDV